MWTGTGEGREFILNKLFFFCFTNQMYYLCKHCGRSVDNGILDGRGDTCKQEPGVFRELKEGQWPEQRGERGRSMAFGAF